MNFINYSCFVTCGHVGAGALFKAIYNLKSMLIDFSGLCNLNTKLLFTVLLYNIMELMDGTHFFLHFY